MLPQIGQDLKALIEAKKCVRFIENGSVELTSPN